MSNRCPECGHPVVLKDGRFGEFFGCTNFPDCRFTCSLYYMDGEVEFNKKKYADILFERELDAIVMESEHGDWGV